VPISRTALARQEKLAAFALAGLPMIRTKNNAVKTNDTSAIALRRKVVDAGAREGKNAIALRRKVVEVAARAGIVISVPINQKEKRISRQAQQAFDPLRTDG
jgi:urease gamma subunit